MFFTILNFILAGLVGVIGIMTLHNVSHPKEVVLASLPILFALHQFVQGFVWLGINGLVNQRLMHMSETAFVFYAQGVLQFLVPLAIWLIEPKGIKKNFIAILMAIGAALMVYTLWGLSVQPTIVTIKYGVLSYDNPSTRYMWIAIIYILTTCGSLTLSNSVAVQLFGWLNVLAIIIIHLVVPAGFTAIWCLYAAAVSVVLYLYFSERRIKFLREIREREHEWSSEFELELIKLEGRFPKIREKIGHLI